LKVVVTKCNIVAFITIAREKSATCHLQMFGWYFQDAAHIECFVMKFEILYNLRVKILTADCDNILIFVVVVVTPATQVVVNLPQEQYGPKVMTILPLEKQTTMPYVLNSRVHNDRYVSPSKGFREDFFLGPREEMM